MRRESTIGLGKQEFTFTQEWSLVKAVECEKAEKVCGVLIVEDVECHTQQSGLHPVKIKIL